MKVTWEHFIPVIITVAGGLLLWVVKIAINAIGKSLTREMQSRIDKLESENESLQRQVDRNTDRIDFLWKKLIEINS